MHWLRPFLHPRYRPVVAVVGIFVVVGAVLSTIVVVVVVVVVAVVVVVMLEAVVVVLSLAVAVAFVVAVFAAVVVVVVVVVVAVAAAVQDVAGRAVAALESTAGADHSLPAEKTNQIQTRTLSSVPRLERFHYVCTLCSVTP